jgi:hypothetical protein
MLLTCRGTSGGRGVAGVGVCLTLCVVVLLAPPSARAGAPATQPAQKQKEAPTLESHIRNLANPDPRVREAGRAALLRLGREDLSDLKLAVKKSRPLLPSQAAALHAIVRQVFLSGERYKSEGRGFLGILMDSASAEADFVPENDSRNIGVVVADRIPGFCAGRALQDGDVLLGTAKPFIPFRSSSDLRNTVMPKPGITVLLTVLRQGEVIIVPLTPDPAPQDIISPDQIPPFVAEREKRFSAYWDREFASLLNTRVAG